MAKKKVKIPNRETSPPKMERDLVTGKYTVDKRTVVTNWFKSAKNSGSDTDEFNWTINPKQAVDNSHTTEEPVIVAKRKKNEK